MLESGAWTQSIIWHPNTPFRDFTQLEFNHEDDVVPEERKGGSFYYIFGISFHYLRSADETVRPRKRFRFESGHAKDKYNISNDHYYEVAKDGGKHRVRQTFGQLVVEHAYPAQKLQLPFVSYHLSA